MSERRIVIESDLCLRPDEHWVETTGCIGPRRTIVTGVTDEMVERADHAYQQAIMEHPDPVRNIIDVRREALRAALEAALEQSEQHPDDKGY